MGAGIAGVTKYPANLMNDKRPCGIVFHHQITYQQVYQDLCTGRGEGSLNLNPSTDYKYRDENFTNEYCDQESRAKPTHWLRACEVQRLAVIPDGACEPQEMSERSVSGHEEKDDGRIPPSAEAKYFYTGFSHLDRFFPTDHDICCSDICRTTDKTISYWIAAVTVLTTRIDYLKAIFLGYNRILGAVAIQLWRDAEPFLVIVDDLIPCTHDDASVSGYTPCTYTNDGSIW